MKTMTDSIKRISFAAALAGVAAIAFGAEPPIRPEVAATYGPAGLTSLKVGGLEQLANATVRVTKVRVADSYRNPYELADPYVKDERAFTNAPIETLASAFDPKRKGLTQTFAWGSVAVRYTTAAGKLDARIEVKNTSPQVIEQIEMDLLALVMPKGAKLWTGNDNLGAPVFSCIDPPTETHLRPDPVVVAGTPQANRPLSLVWEARQAGTATLKVTAGNEQAPEPYDGVWNVRPIKAGATEVIEVALRFGPAGLRAQAIAPDLCAAFVKDNPMRLHWPDRRPVTMMQLEYGRGEANNPRGWWGLKDRKEDIRTPEGRAIFDKWIMANADQAIRIAEQAGAQGVIVWDVEGGQYPGSKYYGDPRIMPFTAPEMEAMADAYFKMLREAGLRVGLCLRPHWILPIGVPPSEVGKYQGAYPNMFRTLPFRMAWDKFNIESNGIEFWGYDEIAHDVGTPLTDVKRSPVQRLDDMITYCKRRWGATLFYVDTNHFSRPRDKSKPNVQGGYGALGGWTSKMMSAGQWAEVQRRHPDCLLIPEHEYTQYWASTAPYRQPPHDGVTPEGVTALWPEAFSAIAMNGSADAEIKKEMPTYVKAVERGDLLMTHGWYGPAPVLMDVYAAATATAPVKVCLLADGALTLQGRPVADLKELRKQVAKLVKGKPFAGRRVFVQYAPAASRATRTALVAALEKADAVIVWSQPMGTGK